MQTLGASPLVQVEMETAMSEIWIKIINEPENTITFAFLVFGETDAKIKLRVFGLDVNTATKQVEDSLDNG